MKFLLYISILFFTVNSYAQGSLEAKPAIITLKDLQADTKPTVVNFKVKNTGQKPVIITRVFPVSDALKATWTREPLPPGQTTTITVSFFTTQIPQNFNYAIWLLSNAKEKRTELRLIGNVIDNPEKPELLYKIDFSGLKFKTNICEFNPIYTWQVLSDTLPFYNTTSKPVKVTVSRVPAYLNVHIESSEIYPGKQGRIIITYNAQKRNDYGYDYNAVPLLINGEMNYSNRLIVTAELKEDFSKLTPQEKNNAPVARFDRKEMDFGSIKQGRKATCQFVLHNAGKRDLIIRKIRTSCGCTAVTPGRTTIAPGKATPVKIIFDSFDKYGKQRKSITILTNDPKNPEITLTVKGEVK